MPDAGHSQGPHPQLFIRARISIALDVSIPANTSAPTLHTTSLYPTFPLAFLFELKLKKRDNQNFHQCCFELRARLITF
ncbi:hypothetical protein P692DRAFT_20318724 [Suillus brevipes Sb2]|nr:hypothetical protein P692DRAFT_20318724 [Suillus brevipes Sb2]